MADPAMIAARFAVYVALAALFGLALFSLHAHRGAARPEGLPFRRAICGAAVIGLLCSGLWLACLAAGMSGAPLGALDTGTIGLVLAGGAIGLAWKVRMGALLLALAVALAAGRAPRLAPPVIAALGGIALATLAWTGHGAMDEGTPGWGHLVADIVHLLAAGAWIGALFAFVALAFRRAVDTASLHRVLHGFAATGSVVVAWLVVTGAISGWALVGPANVVALPASDYGRLLLAKLALFSLMLGLAAANRYRHTPALHGTPDRAALVALRRSLAIETAAALLILGAVAWLGMLAPPASA